MKVAGYFRESDDDTTKAPPITSQIEAYHQWCESNNHTSMAEFADDGYSGGDWKRPDWLKSVNEAKRHTYTVLWVWNQDRLARDTEQFLWYYRQMRDAYVRIFEGTSNSYIDMESLGGRVKHQTLAQAAEIFRLVTSEKVKAAYQRKKKAGQNWGRKKIDWDIELAIHLRDSGEGWRTIAEKVGVSYQTVRRALQNRTILEHKENNEIIEGKKPEI